MFVYNYNLKLVFDKWDSKGKDLTCNDTFTDGEGSLEVCKANIDFINTELKTYKKYAVYF